jgi:hypothetical protein
VPDLFSAAADHEPHRGPAHLTSVQTSAAVVSTVDKLTILYGAIGCVEPLTDFRFELGGIQYLAEYEVIEPGEFVCVRIAFLAQGYGPVGQPYITEDGRLGVHVELEEDDFRQVILDSDATPWRA